MTQTTGVFTEEQEKFLAMEIFLDKREQLAREIFLSMIWERRPVDRREDIRECFKMADAFLREAERQRPDTPSTKT